MLFPFCLLGIYVYGGFPVTACCLTLRTISGTIVQAVTLCFPHMSTLTMSILRVSLFSLHSLHSLLSCSRTTSLLSAQLGKHAQAQQTRASLSQSVACAEQAVFSGQSATKPPENKEETSNAHAPKKTAIKKRRLSEPDLRYGCSFRYPLSTSLITQTLLHDFPPFEHYLTFGNHVIVTDPPNVITIVSIQLATLHL